MVLQDHFRPPLRVRHHWHAFHNAWATSIASDLNGWLPAGYLAEPNVQNGIALDAATAEESGFVTTTLAGPGGSEATGWTAPAPTQTIPLPILTDIVEVLVFGREGGPTLAGAIELVSPANKDRPENRDAFVNRCATYLQQGLGLVVVDVVTDRRSDLHRDLLARFGASPVPAGSLNADLHADSYRPVERDGRPSLDIWHEPLAVGEPLAAQPAPLAPGRSAFRSTWARVTPAPAASSASRSGRDVPDGARGRQAFNLAITAAIKKWQIRKICGTKHGRRRLYMDRLFFGNSVDGINHPPQVMAHPFDRAGPTG